MLPHRHHLSPREIAQVLAEHATGVLVILLSVVLRGVIVDGGFSGLGDPRAWLQEAPWHAARVALAHRVALLGSHLSSYLPWAVLATLVLQYSMVLAGLYDRQVVRTARQLLQRLLRAALAAGLTLAAIEFVTRSPGLGRVAIAVGLSVTVLALWAGRLALGGMRGHPADRVLILGQGPTCAHATRAVEAWPRALRLVGRVGDESPEAGALPRLGGWDQLSAILEREPVDRLLIASQPPAGWDLEPIVASRLSGVQVQTAADFAERVTGEVQEDAVDAEFITNGTSQPYGRISRLLDVALACVLAVALAPVAALAALAVLVSSGRPVLFTQRRVGLGGHEFNCYKLRTMVRDSERDGPSWSPPGDGRVTRVGALLRRFRLDELPQLVNVLGGDMAFVGPRPEQPHFVAKLSRALPRYGFRHLVRPGLTGWAQVHGPYGSTEADARVKLRFDLFYIKHRTPWLDLAILFDTLRVLLRGSGR